MYRFSKRQSVLVRNMPWRYYLVKVQEANKGEDGTYENL